MGIPDLTGGTNTSLIKTRKFRIVRFFDGRDIMFCLIVEDDKQVYCISRIGYDIGHMPPVIEIGPLNKIHILSQSSPKIYTFFSYDTSGALDEKEVYMKTDKSAPQLVKDMEKGTIMVVGGQKAVKDVDYADVNGNPVFKGDK